MSLYDPVGQPRTLRGTPSHIELATVSVVNSDGTLDAQMVGRTAIKSTLEVPRWYKPVKGDRILTTNIAGDQNRPIVLAFISDEKGSVNGPQGGFHNPSEPKSELVSVLPSSPVDGQVVYFQNTAMAASGVVWTLRYRVASSSSHKWEFVGGAAIFSEVLTGQTTSSASFIDLATAGPSLTVPLTGDYDAEFGARILNAASGLGVAGLKVGVAEAGNGAEVSAGAASGANVLRALRLTGLAAAEVLKLQYKTTSTSSEFIQRFLYVRPVRVG